MPDNGRPLDTQVGEDGPDVGRLRALVVAVGGMRGQAHAAQVGYNHGIVPRKLRSQGRHMSPVSPKPWISTTAGPDMHRRTVVSLDLLRAEVIRKRLELCRRWQREGECPQGHRQEL